MTADVATGHPARAGKGRLLALVLLVIGVAAASLRANLWKNDLRVREITVEGNTIVGADEIRMLANISPGVPLYGVDLYAVRQRIEANSFIRSASVNRDVPERISITVEERIPVATIAAGELLHCDEEGVILPSVLSTNVFDLPVITGIRKPQAAEAGSRASNPDVRSALAILLMARRVSDESYRRISEVSVGGDGEFMLYTAESGVPVLFGRGDDARKLVKLDAFWREFMEHHGADELAYVDLRFDDQVVVRWKKTGPTRTAYSIEKEQTWTTSL